MRPLPVAIGGGEISGVAGCAANVILGPMEMTSRRLDDHPGL